MVLILDVLDGETVSTGLLALRRDVSGDTSAALVAVGAASRFLASGRVLLALIGADINPIADGVGVTGGTAFVVLFLFGVKGLAS